MADLVSVSVVSPTHTIVPWSIVTVSNPSHKFSDLFQSLKAGVHPSVPTSRELCEAVIDCCRWKRQTITFYSRNGYERHGRLLNVLKLRQMLHHVFPAFHSGFPMKIYMNNDLPPSWKIENLLTINCESTLCGLMLNAGFLVPNIMPA